MKILVLSNFYPPHHIGGYEMGCREVVERLAARGHDVRVLTSTHGVARAVIEGYVHRELTVLLTLPTGVRRVVALLKKEWNNQRVLRRLVRDFNPDLIYIWNPTFGIGTLLNTAVDAERPVVCFVSDHWMTIGFDIDPVIGLLSSKPRNLKILLARLVLRAGLVLTRCIRSCRLPRMPQVQFASQYLQEISAGAIPPSGVSEVIHWGIDIERFPRGDKPFPYSRALYVGRLERSKGVHTALDGFLKVANRPDRGALQLTIVGGAVLDQDYENVLRASAARSPAGNRVTFTGAIPAEKVAEAYCDHEILLFPSEWDEPFSIALLEAMSCGLAVVGTLTGGTGEILVDGETGVTYRTGDSMSLAEVLEKLLGDPGLSAKVTATAAGLVRERHTISQMVDRIETSLKLCIDTHHRKRNLR